MPVTIAVIAASGKSGQIFVRAALNAGYQVRAGVYGPHNLRPHKNLSLIETDATNRNHVEKLLEGATTVVSLIGHTRRSPIDVQAHAITTVLSVMHEKGIKRLISLTGTGVRQAGDKISFIDRILNLSIGMIDPKRIADGIKHVDLLKASSTDWTVIRVLKLSNGKADTFRLSSGGPAKFLTPRAEVAQAILDVIAQNSHIHQLPVISPLD